MRAHVCLAPASGSPLLAGDDRRKALTKKRRKGKYIGEIRTRLNRSRILEGRGMEIQFGKYLECNLILDKMMRKLNEKSLLD